MSLSFKQISQDEIGLMEDLMVIFADAFADADTYLGNRPSAQYLRSLLGTDYFIALVAINNGEPVGGLAAYELRKFEQQRSEIYIYDLAVAVPHRRQGVATGLIEELKRIAGMRGAYIVFVQADTSVEDQPAIALYTKLGRREQVLHFDIPVET